MINNNLKRTKEIHMRNFEYKKGEETSSPYDKEDEKKVRNCECM